LKTAKDTGGKIEVLWVSFFKLEKRAKGGFLRMVADQKLLQKQTKTIETAISTELFGECSEPPDGAEG
jgi:hypothetical protein